MSIICYPRDDVDFLAADAGAFFATRTSGVYCADDNLAVSISAARQLTVSSGIAWFRTDIYWGKVFVNTADIILDLPDADGALDRICRVVIRWDKTANEATIILRQGELSDDPVAPVRNETDDLYELVLADYLVEHGETEANVTRLTDQRLDEDLCGLMSDGVTAIPTSALEAQFYAMLAELAAALQTALGGGIPNHASTHASTGDDPITPASINALPDDTTPADIGAAALDSNGKLLTSQDSLIQSFKDADWTLVLTDADHKFFYIGTNAVSVTVPPDVFPIGIIIPFTCPTSGSLTFVAGSGVTIHAVGGYTVLSEHPSAACLMHIDTNVWVLTGCDS